MASPVVTIHEGKLRGCQRANFEADLFYCFLGVPYAKPPLGELRFKDPEPVESWPGIRDATKEGDACFQRHEYLFNFYGSEDCLHLNVFTKSLPSENNQLKPVMVWIHGGAFLWGSNKLELFGPEHLMTEDIVLVTINYRLGFLGFLRMEHLGNAGLKDQQLALKWVQRNIKHFNGDSGNVTIFGESAGSASVHYHVVSPNSEGLFHKAIMQSGTLLNPWPVYMHPSIRFAQSIKSDIKTEEEALAFLQNLSVEDLYREQQEYCAAYGAVNVAGPTIEKPNKSAFLTEHPANLITSGTYNKVPILLGYNSQEGMLFDAFSYVYEQHGEVSPFMNSKNLDLEMFVYPHMNLDKNDPKRKAIISRLREFYVQGNYQFGNFMLIGYFLFVAGVIGAAKLHAKTSSQPVYLYRMSLEAGANMVKNFIKSTVPGAYHQDELGYLFKVEVLDHHFQKGDLEHLAIKRFVKLWTNFARTGNPTPQGNDLNVTWKPVSQDEVAFLDIGKDLVMSVDPESERMKLWREIFQQSSATANFL